MTPDEIAREIEPTSVAIEDLNCHIYYADSMWICLDLSAVVLASKDDDNDGSGPSWDSKKGTLTLSYKEAQLLGRVLCRFAAALHATNPEFFDKWAD